eukprot:c47744_g1_i1 orf=56-1345(+)
MQYANSSIIHQSDTTSPVSVLVFPNPTKWIADLPPSTTFCSHKSRCADVSEAQSSANKSSEAQTTSQSSFIDSAEQITLDRRWQTKHKSNVTGHQNLDYTLYSIKIGYRCEDQRKQQNRRRKRAVGKEDRQAQRSDTAYRGVRKRKWGRWVSEIRQPKTGIRIWLGSFSKPEMAAIAHDVAAFNLKGDLAVLNFPHLVHCFPRSISLSPRDIRKAAMEAATTFLLSISQESDNGNVDRRASTEEGFKEQDRRCVNEEEENIYLNHCSLKQLINLAESSKIHRQDVRTVHVSKDTMPFLNGESTAMEEEMKICVPETLPKDISEFMCGHPWEENTRKSLNIHDRLGDTTFPAKPTLAGEFIRAMEFLEKFFAMDPPTNLTSLNEDTVHSNARMLNEMAMAMLISPPSVSEAVWPEEIQEDVESWGFSLWE